MLSFPFIRSEELTPPILFQVGVAVHVGRIGITEIGPRAELEVPEIGSGKTQIELSDLHNLIRKHRPSLSPDHGRVLRNVLLDSRKGALR